MITKAIFRKWPTREVVALFPEVPFDEKGTFCSSYSHVGQHGPANHDLCLKLTTAAKPDEYEGLATELQELGYQLKPIQRASAKVRQARINSQPK